MPARHAYSYYVHLFIELFFFTKISRIRDISQKMEYVVTAVHATCLYSF